MEKLTSVQGAFFKDEISYLRNTFSDAIKETRNHERFSLLSTGTIWSWYAINIMKNRSPEDYAIILWIPAVITFLFGIRSWGISMEMLRIQNYLIKIEKAIDLPDDLGWEQNIKSDRYRFEIITVYLFWFLLQSATIFVPFYI